MAGHGPQRLCATTVNAQEMEIRVGGVLQSLRIRWCVQLHVAHAERHSVLEAHASPLGRCLGSSHTLGQNRREQLVIRVSGAGNPVRPETLDGTPDSNVNRLEIVPGVIVTQKVMPVNSRRTLPVV